ncbi:MAG: hypothetical protein AAF824_18595 [Bacteroidota bacterium]
MKKLLLLFLSVVLFSCSESDIEEFEPRQQDTATDVVTDRSGREYPFLDPNVISYCGPAWGRKFCRFLDKYEETIWADTENDYSDFSDIKFSNFSYNGHFISFFNLDSATSYCDGWKLGETTYDGIKWNIKIKKDQEDVLWFDYEYYGSSEEIEYTLTYKYEVIDGLLHFSSSEGQTFIFNPSEKDYSIDVIETGEIIRLEGCMFY